MKGCFNMKRISSEQQLQIITELFLKEIDILKSLPKEEAEKRARKNLLDAGIVDVDGNYTEPYIALENYV